MKIFVAIIVSTLALIQGAASAQTVTVCSTAGLGDTCRRGYVGSVFAPDRLSGAGTQRECMFFSFVNGGPVPGETSSFYAIRLDDPNFKETKSLLLLAKSTGAPVQVFNRLQTMCGGVGYGAVTGFVLE
jgi:hypothetical protein